MLTREQIEDIIVGMSEIVRENRILRESINELQMECEKYKAYFYGETDKAEILSDISINNSAVKAMKASGWLSNQEYIEDWRAELTKRLEERGANDE